MKKKYFFQKFKNNEIKRNILINKYFISFIFNIFLIYFFITSISAAHYIVGYVNNSRGGIQADNHTILIWNPLVGLEDNLTEIIGISGSSGVRNVYMIDCEMLNNSCKVGDIINIQVIDNGDGYFSNQTYVNITGAGFDSAQNLFLITQMNISSIIVDDFLSSPSNEIDLLAATNQTVNCEAIIVGLDGASLFNISSQFFNDNLSFYGDSNDNNIHYTNNSCFINQSYNGSHTKKIICSFPVQYYSNSGNWSCRINIMNNYSIETNNSDNTFINTLLAIGVDSPVDYGEFNIGSVTDEKQIDIINYGNQVANLSLKGYGQIEGDGFSMICNGSGSNNLSVYHEKYNLTQSNFGEITLNQMENIYKNLTSESVINSFNIKIRENDLFNDAINSSYWRMYVPIGAFSGSCQGNLIFGAVIAPGE
ncbi:MAG: hypothetical protein WC867_07170 [Candidatus Pacearchaeota archaeon]|jgi:hypothetical protein